MEIDRNFSILVYHETDLLHKWFETSYHQLLSLHPLLSTHVPSLKFPNKCVEHCRWQD